jgi:hypothetical protein
MEERSLTERARDENVPCGSLTCPHWKDDALDQNCGGKTPKGCSMVYDCRRYRPEKAYIDEERRLRAEEQYQQYIALRRDRNESALLDEAW